MSDNTKRILKYTAVGALGLGAIGLLAGGRTGYAALGTAVAGTYVVGATFAVIGGLSGALVAQSRRAIHLKRHGCAIVGHRAVTRRRRRVDDLRLQESG